MPPGRWSGGIFLANPISYFGEMSFRQRIFRIVDEDARDYRPSRLFNGFIVFLIFVNMVAIIFESDDRYATAYADIFHYLELVSVVIFGLEYLMRLLTADFSYPHLRGARPYFRYLISPLAIIDLLAILPSILILVAPYFVVLAGQMDFRIIRLLRTMRLLRIFKITRYSSSLRLIIDVFRDKARDLAVTIFITLMLMVISSTIMYYVEHNAQEEQFPNILATFWWAVATLTTVGYGDVYPITALGKLLSGIIALLGIGLVALPTGILSSAFVDQMEKRRQGKLGEEGEEASPEVGADSCEQKSKVTVTPFCPYCGKELGPDGRPIEGSCPGEGDPAS